MYLAKVYVNFRLQMYMDPTLPFKSLGSPRNVLVLGPTKLHQIGQKYSVHCLLLFFLSKTRTFLSDHNFEM
jgi:hypothetical protein